MYHKINSEDMNGFIFAGNEEGVQEPPSPEDESVGSFHTPQHVAYTDGGSYFSVLTSQDSIDVFHDAFSTLQRVPPLPLIHQSPPHDPCQRRRHASSGAKFEEGGRTEESWDDTNESTCMLPKGPVARVRHRSQGQGSRSCNTSPFHTGGRLSFSTNSLKRRPAERVWDNSPQKQCLMAAAHGMSNYVPCVEVEMIKESEELDKSISQNLQSLKDKNKENLETSMELAALRRSERQKEGICQNNRKSVPLGSPSNWMINYVACTELRTLFDLNNASNTINEEKFKRALINQDLKNRTEGNENTFTKKMKRQRRGCQRIKEEFATANLKLDHKAPHLFVTSQWQQSNQMSCLYLAYRLFWGVYFTMWAIWSWVGFAGYNSPPHMKRFYLIYLTDWGIWLLAVDTMLQAVNVALHMKKISEEGEARYYKMKRSLKASWLLSNVTSTMHIFITAVFWIGIYPHGPHIISAISINTHIIPCCYVLLDIVISATPRRIFHAYYPMVFLLVYGAFTAVYYSLGGLSHKGTAGLYTLLDWSKPYETLMIGVALVSILIPLIHILIICTIYGIKVKLWRIFKITRYTQEDDEIETVRSVSREEKV